MRWARRRPWGWRCSLEAGCFRGCGPISGDAWVRRLIGAAVLLGVVAIARGWDRGTLTRLSRLHTDSTEQTLIRLLRPERLAAETTAPTPEAGSLPELDGAVGWINSPPLTRESLRGKVVLIDF